MMMMMMMMRMRMRMLMLMTVMSPPHHHLPRAPPQAMMAVRLHQLGSVMVVPRS
jgi:hypothetical protein